MKFTIIRGKFLDALKTVQNIVFQAKESQTLSGSDADVEGLIQELLNEKIIG